MPDLLLSVLGFSTVAAALGVILSKEAVHSALFLTLHLLGIGTMFLALHHQFLAVAQMLIYAGAVMVVFMFAVTTLSPREEPFRILGDNGVPLIGMAAGSAVFGVLLYSISHSDLKTRALPLDSGELPKASSFAVDLFGPYLLPFEGTAFLLLTALIGAIILGGRRQVGDG